MMIRIQVIALLLLMSTTGLSAELSRPDDPQEKGPKDTVQIYLDFTGASLGRSPYRQLRFELELAALKHYRSYPVAEPSGWSTAVFVSSSTAESLAQGKLPISHYITERETGLYHLNYEGIRLMFRLEIPPQKVLDMVARIYANIPEVGQTVMERYRSGYTVRIYEAENVLEPENQLISYPEAVLAATIIGDREQWLWGIHDGRDLLNTPKISP